MHYQVFFYFLKNT